MISDATKHHLDVVGSMDIDGVKTHLLVQHGFVVTERDSKRVLARVHRATHVAHSHRLEVEIHEQAGT
jgi:hypothetical protein